MIREVLVLGGGSAGLIAALTLHRKIPNLSVRIVRSPEIGVIGVGESTTPIMPDHLFEFLKIRPRRFYELAEPTWKMGIHFLWGPRNRSNIPSNHSLMYAWRNCPAPTATIASTILPACASKVL